MNAQLPPGSAPGEEPPSEERPGEERPSFRASDSDRDQIAGFLGDHYAQGRLTLEEYHDRIAATYSARTWKDLAGQVCDLPDPPAFLERPQVPAGPPFTGPQPQPPGPAPAESLIDGDDDIELVVMLILIVMFPPAGLIYWLVRHQRRSRRVTNDQLELRY